MNDDLKLDELFQAYRAACPEVEPGANFMPGLWQRIESRHTFWFVFRNLARTTVAACAALCLLLVFLNFVPPFEHSAVQALNYTDTLMAEHTAENTDFTENIHNSTVDEEVPAVENH
jgi:uncharacterized membrane protein